MSRKLLNREAELFLALKKTNPETGEYPAHFNVYERMLINQERAGIFRALAAMDDDHDIERYTVSEKIEQKIQWIINLNN